MSISSSNRFRPALLGLGAVAVIVVCLEVNRRTGDSPGAGAGPAKTAELSPHEQLERARLQQKIAALEADMASLRHGGDVPPAPGPVTESAAEPAKLDDATARLGDAEVQARRKQEEERIFSHIGETFSAQPVDAAWATAMTERIGAQPLEKSSVGAIECRSSACRIEISLREGADLGAIRESLRTRLADVLGTGASKRDESGRFILYLGKDPVALGI